MANKDASVKNATDKELNEGISKETSINNLYHEANKSKTIKNSTDQELNELLKRLKKEHEIQDLIRDMKIRSQTKEEAIADDNYYNSFGVSTEVPIENLYHKVDEVLAHFGIFGMKWGRRKATSKHLSTTRVTGKEESDFWKNYAKTLTKANKKANKKVNNQVSTTRVTGKEESDFWKNYAKTLTMGESDTADAVLAHFGIAGMRWGRKKSSFKTTRVKSNNASDHDRAKALNTKGIKKLSNDQINTLLKRINLEKQMRDVQTTKLKRGEDIAKSILGIGTSIVGIYALSKTPLGEAIKAKFKR